MRIVASADKAIARWIRQLPSLTARRLTEKVAIMSMQFMKAKIIAIGYSRGIRFPTRSLELTQLSDEVELEAERDRTIIRSARKPREGWDEACKAMDMARDEALFDTPVPTNFDKKEWDW